MAARRWRQGSPPAGDNQAAIDAMPVAIRPILRGAGLLGLGLAVAGATLWGALALGYSDLQGGLWLGAAFALATFAAFLLLPGRRRTLLGWGIAFALLLLWWTSIEPSNQRDWQPEVAVLPHATRDGDLVT